MLVPFVIFGVIVGLLLGFIMAIRMVNEWEIASILMIPTFAFLGGLISYIVSLKLDAIARFNTTYGLPILGVGVLVFSVLCAVTHLDEIKILVTRIKNNTRDG